MLDYINLKIVGVDIQRLESLQILEFISEFSEKSGEISNKKIATYHFCKIIIYDNGMIVFKGSIHKMHNSINNVFAPNFNAKKTYKGYNGNDFTINHIFEIRKHLEYLFNCNSSQMTFQNLEFGFNISTSFNPQLFITSLLFHHGNSFEFKFNRYFAQVTHTRFLLKIYNKSNQYGMDKHTLRIELKTKKMHEIFRKRRVTFADINTSTFEICNDVLHKKLKEIVYFDSTISKSSLNKTKRLNLAKYSNQNYWVLELTPKNRHYNKLQLNDIILNHSENLKDKIISEINKKFGIINRVSNTQKFGIINRFSKEGKFGIINTSYLPLNIPLKDVRICCITGLDISMQKEDSILLSHTGLYYYCNTNRELFNLIKEKYLTSKWKNESIQIQIKKIAGNIRTIRKNRLNKQKIIYPRYQIQLFNIKP